MDPLILSAKKALNGRAHPLELCFAHVGEERQAQLSFSQSFRDRKISRAMDQMCICRLQMKGQRVMNARLNVLFAQMSHELVSLFREHHHEVNHTGMLRV